MYLFQKKLSAAFAAFVCLIFILSACKSVDPEKEKLAKELEKAEKERRDQWFLDADGKKIAPERDMVEEMLKSSPFTAVPYIFEMYLPSHPHARSQESKIFGRVFLPLNGKRPASSMVMVCHQ